MLLAALLLAQTAPCAAMDTALPAPLAAWNTPLATLTPGAALILPTAEAPGAKRPGRAATTRFQVTASGTYGVALDQKGWIDVSPDAAGSAALVSAAHGHGPDCSTIRKIVRFDLKPGWYRLELSGLANANAKVMLVAPD